MLAPLAVAGTGRTSAAASSLQTVAARASDDVRQTLGVNVKTGYGGVYKDQGRMRALLSELQVMHVRDAVWQGRSDQWSALGQLTQIGVRANIVCGRPSMLGGSPERLVGDLAAHCPGAIESIEGANEWNISGRSGWAPELRSHQRRLYAAVKAQSAFRSVPVLAPSLALRRDRDVLGDLSDVCDRGNNHLYCGGRVPTRYVDQELAAERTVSGTHPIVVTETGYHNALTYTGGHLPTSEAAAATYFPRLLMEYARRGVPRIYSYELIDQGTSQSDHEQAFGLARADGSRKPAFIAIRRLLALLADSGGAWQPGTLSYGVSGGDGSVQQLLMQRRDRTFLLALWRDVEIWDPLAHREKKVASTRVTLSLPTSRLLTLYSPSQQEGALRSARGTRLDVDLSGNLMIVAISG